MEAKAIANDGTDLLAQVRTAREKFAREGPPRMRRPGDFERVTLPERDCDALRDLLIAERAATVIEIGLAYGSSALAIGEALMTVDAPNPQHVAIDLFQASAFDNVGWEVLCAAGLERISRLLVERSSIALPRLVAEGFTADEAFVDGSHRFHEVFVDLYFLRKIVRPGGLVILDDLWWPSVATAVHYYESNLGWQPVAGRSIAGRSMRVPGNLDCVPSGCATNPSSRRTTRSCHSEAGAMRSH